MVGIQSRRWSLFIRTFLSRRTTSTPLRGQSTSENLVPKPVHVSSFLTNSGLISILLCTWLFNAAQRSCTELPFVLLANCAIFLLNLSLSCFSIFSFLFNAPGRLFMLFKLLRCASFAPPCSPLTSLSSRPESASARDSRLATSVLFGLRRLRVFDEDFSILETNEECFILCLSFLELGNRELLSTSWTVVGVGRPVRVAFARVVTRFLIGAWNRR